MFLPNYTEKKKAKIKRWKEKGDVSYSGNGRDFMLGVKSIVRNGIKYIKNWEDKFIPEIVSKNGMEKKEPKKNIILNKSSKKIIKKIPV